jgi:hypothetical protein
MAAVPLPRSQELDAAVLSELSRVGVLQGTGALASTFGGARIRKLGWPELERVLPDHGLPNGVVEIASPLAKAASPEVALRGGATTVALAAVRGAHEADDKAWCAWVTCPAAVPSLYAPSAAQAGVDLERLLVVRAEPASLARAAVKVATSGAFDVVIVDALTGLDGRLGGLASASGPGSGLSPHGGRSAGRSGRTGKVDGALVVRKLALAAEDNGATIVLLTNGYAPRTTPWPVALRLEVERRPDAIAVRVTKDRRGRVSGAPGHELPEMPHDMPELGHMRAAMHVVRVP